MNFELLTWNYFFSILLSFVDGAGSGVALDDYYVHFAHASVRQERCLLSLEFVSRACLSRLHC